MTDVARATQTVTINSGALLSTDIDLRKTGAVGIAAPVLTSGQLFLQVGNNSGTYVGRLHDPRSQAAWFWNVAAGSAAIVVDAPIRPFTHAAIEVANSQAALRTFTIAKARG